MIILSKYKYNYRKNLSVSFIVSVTVVALLVLVLPEPVPKISVRTAIDNYIPVEFIPATVQMSKGLTIPEKKNVNSIIPSEVVEEKTPDIVEVDVINSGVDFTGTSEIAGTGENDEAGLPGYGFSARQILEVVPPKNKNLSGSIKLSLLVGVEGKVIEHIVSSNSIDCEDCLKGLLDAVYKSRWQPLLKNGKKIEFWTEKLYEFN